MGTSAPKAPPPPDPYKVAGAQTGQNVQSAIADSYLGNVDQVGPYGSTTYTQGGTYAMTGPDGQTYQVPRFTQTQTLSPGQQKLYDQQTELGVGLNNLALSQTQRLSDHLSKPIDFSGLPDVSNDFSADRARVEQAMFDRVAGQNQRDYDALENRLTNQGFMRGTQAFNDAIDEHRRGINDQKLAITARGLAEQQGLYGMASNRRAQAMQEMLQARNQPINEIAALMGAGRCIYPARKPIKVATSPRPTQPATSTTAPRCSRSSMSSRWHSTINTSPACTDLVKRRLAVRHAIGVAEEEPHD